MKKPIVLSLLSLMLLSCGGESGLPGVKNVALISLNESREIATITNLPMCFFDLPEVPYISIEAAFGLAANIRQQKLEDDNAGYFLSRNGNVITVKDEAGDTATFDLGKQTITFSDFDAFFQGNRENAIPNSIANPNKKTKSYRIVKEETSYQKGNMVTLDLKNYPSIVMKEHEGTAYLPYCVFNDLMQGFPAGMVTFSYNFKDAYLDPQGFRNISTGKLTDLGSKYYGEAPKKSSISKEFASFNYDQTMFGLDYFYGLKSTRGIDSFKAFSKEKGLDSDMLSGDLAKMQAAYGTLLLKHLEDGHTAPLAPSPMTDYNTYEVDPKWMSEKAIKKAREDKAFRETRTSKAVTKPFEVVGDTAFIYFDDFMDLDEEILYGELTPEVIAGNNAALFAYAYKQIKADSKIKNVVVDLATNNGGDSEGLVYCLGTLLGKFHIDSGNGLSKSHTRVTYLTDINIDGTIDDKDVPLCKDHNIYMLDTKFAFSCGNLFPVAAKYNSDKVKTIGDRTGGGTCTIKYATSAVGALSVSSSLVTLYKKVNDVYTNIENGADVDISWTYEKMFDRADIVTAIAPK